MNKPDKSFGTIGSHDILISKRSEMTEELRELVGMKLVNAHYCSTGEPILTLQSLDDDYYVQIMFKAVSRNIVTHGINKKVFI